jgi:protein ImuB
LRGPLGELPVEVLPVDKGLAESFQGLGLRHIGDCLRLPRAGLARRFGPEFVALLDRALGRRADLQAPFEPPAHFERRVDLAYEVDRVEPLQFVARRLLLELSGFLRARGAGTQQLDWRLLHRDRRESRVRLALVGASRDPEHLGHLLRLQLERWVLPMPVRAIKLIVTDLQPLAETTRPLLPDAREQNRTQSLVFLERLRARLGQDAVSGLGLIADHRPEAAWRFCKPGEASVLRRANCRPLWLLRQPHKLITQAGRPELQGPLELLGRGERIEGGWWEGQPIARDYFIARQPAGGRYWIFREVEGERRWFVHGIFD